MLICRPWPAMVSSNPHPSRGFLSERSPRKKRSKTRGNNARGMPGPVLAIANSTVSPALCRAIFASRLADCACWRYPMTATHRYRYLKSTDTGCRHINRIQCPGDTHLTCRTKMEVIDWDKGTILGGWENTSLLSIGR